MTIRKRLAFFIFIMMSLLILSGGVLLVGGPIILGAFSQSLESMNSLNDIRELRYHVVDQRTSLNRYLLLDEKQELLSFEEATREARKNLESMILRNQKSNQQWIASLSMLYGDVEEKADQVVNLYKRGNKPRAYELAAGIFDALIVQVDGLEKQKTQEAQSMFRQIQGIINQAKYGILAALGFALLVCIVLFRSLYQAVMNPLEILRQGADEFGQGRWDHKIELSSKNEFGSLAESFNTMAENVKQLQLQAAHMDRMSAVGQLAGGVAHEINNPLTAVLGQAQILMAKLTEADPMYAQLSKIENAALRCKKIVRGLLDFSRPSQTTFEDIDANEVLAATLDLCEADLKKAKINVDKRFTKALPHFQGNSSELQQVLLNLINNAIQAMPRGGTLTLDTRISNETLTLFERRKGMGPRKVAGPWVEISVKDTGIGISKEHLARVFEPFFTTKEIGKGTGLGLAVSVGIIQKHGGDLRVESAGLNKGASFTIALPLKKSSMQDVKQGMAA